MTQSKYTPAPWKVFYAKNNGQLILGVGQDTGEGIIASNGSFWGDDDEAKANAEHVVKCVNLHDELLEVLEQLYSGFKSRCTEGFQIKIEKAIAKAKGEV